MGDDRRKTWQPRVRRIVEVPANRIQALRLEGLQTFDNGIGELLPVQVRLDPLEQEQIVFGAQTLIGEEGIGGKTQRLQHAFVNDRNRTTGQRWRGIDVEIV